MDVDPSLLPATVATCTAALVAIVGGLVAGQRVAREAEIRTAQARVARLEADASEAQKTSELDQAALLEAEAQVWLACMSSYLVRLDRRHVDAATLLQQTPAEYVPLGYEAKELQTYVDDACGRVGEAMTDVKAAYGESEPLSLPNKWGDVYRVMNVPMKQPRDGLTEVIYSRAYENLFKEWRASRGANGNGDSPGTVEVIGLPDERSTALKGTVPLDVARETARISRRKLDDAVGRCRVVAAGADALVQVRKSDRRLFILLAVFGLLGVVGPLVMLAWGPDHTARWLSWALVAVVFLGIPATLLELVGRLRWPWEWLRKSR